MRGMDKRTKADDAKLIKELGGATKVAELLGLENAGSVQRVHNWIKRGIPWRVKVERPDLFMRGKGKQQAATQ